MSKVLVLMSTYNGEKYLREQLDSLLKQKNVLLDILIRDDMSSDNTKDILSEYVEKYGQIKVAFDKNVGACQSFLELIKMASIEYDYYAFCDQDDVWLEDKLIAAINKIENSNRPSLYYSGQILVDKDLNKLYNHKIDINRSKYANFIFNQAAGCTIVFNKSLMNYLKKYMPNNVYGHDVWCYKLCMALGGNIFLESEGKILYRQHGSNVVGIENGIKGKFNRAKKYIFKYSPSSYSKELIKGYASEIDEDIYQFISNIVTSNNSFKSRFRLLTNKKIKFNSFSLRMLFILKVLLKKM